MKHSAEYWKKKLNLRPHPEGGCYRETYRSRLNIPANAVSPLYSGPRPASTAIYFLLEKGTFSAFHRVSSDELWHFHDGGTLLIHMLDKRSGHKILRLGLDQGEGTEPQALVPKMCWFAAELESDDGFALVSCTVAPGFEFADLEIADQARLLEEFPDHEGIVRRLCASGGNR